MKANEVIRLRRKELGLTMREVANKVGVSEATVSRWESGDIRNMRRDKIAALARALDVAVRADLRVFEDPAVLDDATFAYGAVVATMEIDAVLRDFL